ncbi:MAG: DUF3791 domain-containing protein [Bacteroidales bacterium]|nr:DUF3791 domain-containing protein [Bacteroidales bacterium]
MKIENPDNKQFFILFSLEAYRNKHEMTGNEVYVVFKDYNVFDFLQSSYDLLHTQSIDYVVAEIDEYIKSKNEAVSQ